ncbi:hypothetical protein ACLOJK_000229 [Asimina triloba]
MDATMQTFVGREERAGYAFERETVAQPRMVSLSRYPLSPTTVFALSDDGHLPLRRRRRIPELRSSSLSSVSVSPSHSPPYPTTFSPLSDDDGVTSSDVASSLRLAS